MTNGTSNLGRDCVQWFKGVFTNPTTTLKESALRGNLNHVFFFGIIAIVFKIAAEYASNALFDSSVSITSFMNPVTSLMSRGYYGYSFDVMEYSINTILGYIFTLIALIIVVYLFVKALGNAPTLKGMVSTIGIPYGILVIASSVLRFILMAFGTIGEALEASTISSYVITGMFSGILLAMIILGFYGLLVYGIALREKYGTTLFASITVMFTTLTSVYLASIFFSTMTLF